jgi:porin
MLTRLLFSLTISLASLASAQPEGLEFEAVLTLEGIANLDGGVDEDEAFLGNLDLTAELDTGKAGLWADGTLFAYVLGNFDLGRLPTEFVGDLQATSNIETFETIKLYEFWYQHQLTDEFSVLAGLHDYNGEFDVLEFAGLFAHSSAGISADISQVGPSIFATTAIGVRAHWQNTAGSYVLAAIYDGVPGDPDNERSTQIILDSDDGIFAALELGHASTDDRYWKAAIGGWFLSEATATDGDAIDNYGAYLIAESGLSDKGLDGPGIFIQLGTARPDDNAIEWYVGGGLTWTDMIREDDQAGIGIFHAHMDDDFRALNPGLPTAETAIELTYRTQIHDRLVIQPGVQYVIDPAGGASADDALVAFLRAEISLW